MNVYNQIIFKKILMCFKNTIYGLIFFKVVRKLGSSGKSKYAGFSYELTHLKTVLIYIQIVSMGDFYR